MARLRKRKDLNKTKKGTVQLISHKHGGSGKRNVDNHMQVYCPHFHVKEKFLNMLNLSKPWKNKPKQNNNEGGNSINIQRLQNKERPKT